MVHTLLAVGGGSIHWGIIAAVVVAAVVGALNLWQVYLTRSALAAARDATREAMKARVDEQAPRVVVHPVNRDRFVWYPSTTGGNPNPAERGDQMMFRVPTQNNERLFVRVQVGLRNEGASSAWVSSSVKFLAAIPAGEARACYVYRPALREQVNAKRR